MNPRSIRSRFPNIVLLAMLVALLSPTATRAQTVVGLADQPKPDAATLTMIQKAVQDIAGTGDLSRARPALLLAVEKAAASDITDILAPALSDSTTYFGVLATFEEALRDATGKNADFVRYNLARWHLLYARRQSLTRDRNSVLGDAAQIAAPFRAMGTPREFAALEIAGDIESERGKYDDAVAIYRRILTLPSGEARGFSPKAFASYKIGLAQQRAGRTDAARQSYDEAIRQARIGGGSAGLVLHNSYQNLADLYLRQGNSAAALQSLAQSARVTQDAERLFRPRTDVARRILQRGFHKEVSAYAAAVTTLAPGDSEVLALGDDAGRGR